MPTDGEDRTAVHPMEEVLERLQIRCTAKRPSPRRSLRDVPPAPEPTLLPHKGRNLRHPFPGALETQTATLTPTQRVSPSE